MMNKNTETEWEYHLEESTEEESVEKRDLGYLLDKNGGSDSTELEHVICCWLDSTENNAKYLVKQHMLNMPQDIMAEATANWKSHNGLIREQDDLVNVDAYHMSDTGYMRYVAKSLMQQDSAFFRQQCLEDSLTELHRHDYVEIAYVLKGSLKQNIVGQDEVFQEGEVCVIGQNSLHQDYLTYQDSTVLFLGISNELFEREDDYGKKFSRAQDFFRKLVIRRKKDLKFIRFTPRPGAREQLEPVIAAIVKENALCRPGYESIVAGLLERMNTILMSQYQIALSKKEQTQVRKLLFDDVIDYIDQNYADVTLNDLCKKFSYNTYYFNRLIKENTGLTYSQYLQKVRLDKAAFYLKTTHDSIERIALRVGYTNQGFFYEKFELRFGVSPREYRLA
ncbi:AraC-type DNA-binding protein [Lachnospiraceae bacterium A10]|jgi:AraC-like DNA-binding protein/mannose-6-phosphate isomerase-like protein (cupin superfamily)|nr:AraC-type DNA-binding protein [Lachnospiraceae bacterium A10]